jgi:adenylosuccinate lyase
MIERYTLPEMGAIWTLQNKFQKWLDVEIAVCEVHAEDGIIPAEDLANIKSKAAFSVERINEIEKTTDHDVIAFTTNLAENIGESARFVHYGLTSSDVVDTANALLLKEACELLLQKIDRLLEVLQKRAFEFKDTPQIGRTHGIHAEPASFGLTWALWYAEMRRNRERLEKAKEAVSVGKISGAVGAFAHLDPEVEERVCRKLGIKAAEVSTQVIQRDRYAEYLCALGIIAGTLEKIAIQNRTERLVGDAAQTQPDFVGANLRNGANRSRQHDCRAGKHRALARTRYFSFFRRTNRSAGFERGDRLYSGENRFAFG